MFQTLDSASVRSWGDSGLVTWTSSSKVILIFLGKKTESKVCKLKTCVIIIMWNIPLKIINEFHTIYCFICVTSTINDKEWRFKNQGITHNGIQMCIRDAWKNTHLSYFNLNHDSGRIILCDYRQTNQLQYKVWSSQLSPRGRVWRLWRQRALGGWIHRTVACSQ